MDGLAHEMEPGVVHGTAIVDSLKKALALLDMGGSEPAYLELKRLADSIIPYCCTFEGGEPIPPEEGSLKVQSPIEDLSELEELQRGGSCRVKISLWDLLEDLTPIMRSAEQGKITEAREGILRVLAELEKLGSRTNGATGSKYEFFGEVSDLVLQARSEIKRSAKTLVARYIEEDECRQLLGKYIEEAYELGKKEAQGEA